MKIVTWNCQQAFLKKASRIFTDSPDVAVIQECSKRSTEPGQFEGFSGHWVGKNPHKGVAVFVKEGWTVRPIAETRGSDPKWIVPFSIEGERNFTLIAVWACAIQGNHRASYVGQIHKALQWRRNWFNLGPIVMAGDFNSNAVLDKKRRKANHTTMVDELRDRYRLVSAYHTAYGIEHGKEETPTFHLYRHIAKPYHFDYIFLPQAWTAGMSVSIGKHQEWSCDSDHCPIAVEINDRT